jgi:hypothetical protein
MSHKYTVFSHTESSQFDIKSAINPTELSSTSTMPRLMGKANYKVEDLSLDPGGRKALKNF